MDWVEAIGFQHEVVHTGALHHLLSLPVGVSVARALTGDETIERVGKPRKEVILRPGSRRKVDLAAEITCGANAGCLGVEVKGDSAWTSTQLREAVGEDCHGVLLAVGYTRLAVDDREMNAITGYAWPWRLVGPGAFADVVQDHAHGDRELLGYANHLAQEETDQRRAVQAVSDGGKVSWGRPHLGHWAYFSEVVRHRDDPALWERKALISGPLLTRRIVEHDGGVGDYVELTGEAGERRSLCVKTHAPAGALRSSRARLIDLLQELGPETLKLPSARAKTCTAARFPLAEWKPKTVATFVGELIVRISGG
jgi:hypothetical protein